MIARHAASREESLTVRPLVRPHGESTSATSLQDCCGQIGGGVGTHEALGGWARDPGVQGDLQPTEFRIELCSICVDRSIVIAELSVPVRHRWKTTPQAQDADRRLQCELG